MNTIKHFTLISLFILSFNSYSQDRDWTIEKSKDGTCTVKYEMVKEKRKTHFYYIAQTTASVTLAELDKYFSNTANHQSFIEGITLTEEIKKTSTNEWLAYYYYNSPWPFKDNDVVVQINRIIKDNKLLFSVNAMSSDYKKSKINRISHYKINYEFEKITDSTTKITYSADYIPGGYIPRFLMKTWFPEGPASIVKNLGALKKK